MGRACADTLSPLQESQLEEKLKAYVKDRLSSKLPLWSFGPYMNIEATCRDLEKHAPVLPQLLLNLDLFELLIAFMPTGRMKDSHVEKGSARF